MRNIEEYKTTVNNSVYNKSRKIYLEKYGDLRSGRCLYNREENYRGKRFGESHQSNINGNGLLIKFPSWKLSTKNKKQWMFKGPHYLVMVNNSIPYNGESNCYFHIHLY